MRKRVAYILAAALITGGVAAYLAFSVLQDSGQDAETRAATVELVDVVVAARDMKAGTVIGKEDVELVEFPSRSVPSGYSRSPADVVGRGLLTAVHANEPLLSSKLARREAGGGLPITIPEGMRAMSVQVNDVVGVAGFVLPGTRVDVYVVMGQTAGESQPKARLLLQNVPVASAGQTTERDEQGEPKTVQVVTLIVNPAQGEKLALASTEGRIRLALRNTLDSDTVATSGVTASRLVTDPPPPQPDRSYVPQRPSRYSVEVYHGPDRSTSTVEEGAAADDGSGEGGGR